MTLAVGALLQDNRYQIQAVLMSTDIETVYQAVHTYLARTVVLKQLRHDVDWDVSVPPTGRAIMARLLRLAQCQHPCLGQISDCFEEDGQVYLVLPTYGDLTMAKWLQTHGPVKPLDMLAHLRSLVDIFDKFHENGLIYGQLSPHSLHYRTETNELVVTDMSWRMVTADLLGDRHRSPFSKTLDLQRLSYIAYTLLTGDCGTQEQNAQDKIDDSLNGHPQTDPHPLEGTLHVPELHTVRLNTNIAVETVISTALYPQTAQSLTPTDWFIELQQALCSPSQPDVLDKNISEPSKQEGFNLFNIPPYLGDKVLTQPTIDGDVLSESAFDRPLDSVLSLSEESEKGETSSLDNDEPSNEDGYGETLTHQRQHGTRWLRLKRGLPLFFGATSLVAAISGGLLGYVFRIQDVEQLEQSPLFGNEIFGSDQEFPPSDHWPGSSPQVESSPSVLFERSRTQNASQPTPPNRGDVLFSNNGTDVENSSAVSLPVSDPTVRPNEVESANTQFQNGMPETVNTNRRDTTTNVPPAPAPAPNPEPNGPEKTPKPQNVSPQPVAPAPAPVPTSEVPPNPPVAQPSPVRINEMPPVSGQASPSSPPNSAPAPNASTPNRNPAKRPKPLITPVLPPSSQNQSVEVDTVDVSHLMPPDRRSDDEFLLGS